MGNNIRSIWNVDWLKNQSWNGGIWRENRGEVAKMHVMEDRVSRDRDFPTRRS